MKLEKCWVGDRLAVEYCVPYTAVVPDCPLGSHAVSNYLTILYSIDCTDDKQIFGCTLKLHGIVP